MLPSPCSRVGTDASCPAISVSLHRACRPLCSLQARLNRLQFSYSDPTPGFDRSKVSGLVAELISVKEPAAANALEVAAGSKL